MKPNSIICIDGGGLRAAATCQVLIALEKRLNGRIADHFQMIAGTSTGGLLTALLTHPKKYTAQDCADLYTQSAATIFNPVWWRTLRSYVHGAKYSPKGLEDCLKKYLSDTRLSELFNIVLIPAVDLVNRNTKFFTNTDYKKYGLSGDFLIRDVCRATSAAQTYFPSAKIKSLTGQIYHLIDGGNSCNDPSLCALTEMMNQPNKPKLDDIFLFSIGTGSSEKPYHNMQNKGDIAWIKPTINIQMACSSEIVDYHLQRIMPCDNYIRCQLNPMRFVSSEMDNSTPHNMEQLTILGKETVMKNSHLLDVVAERVMGI